MFLVTGGGSGLGRALAKALARREKPVLVVGRRESLLRETAQASSLIHTLNADVSTSAGLDLIQEHLARLPSLEGLVNNAGTLQPMVFLREVGPEAWSHAFKTNLDPALLLPQRLESKLQGGRVLNVSSGAAHFPIKAWSTYCVTKAALSMLTRCWQEESETIAFASVMPGIVDTDMQALARSQDNPDRERADWYQRFKDQSRLLSADTVALFLTWLLLDVGEKEYSAREWDIYDTSHHDAWLKPPHQVPHWDC